MLSEFLDAVFPEANFFILRILFANIIPYFKLKLEYKSLSEGMGFIFCFSALILNA